MNNASSTSATPQWLTKKFSRWPVYVVLLPLFFILHGVRENYGFIMPRDAASLLLLYEVGGLILYLFLFIFYRNHIRTGVLAFLLLSIFFFYGAIQDFLKIYIPSLNRYIFLLPFFLLVIISSSILLKKTKGNLQRLTMFLNLLLVIFVVYDLGAIIIESVSPPKDKFSVYALSETADIKIPDSCLKPDIYFLLFDEYASSDCLKNYLGFDNSGLDSFLIRQQFQIQRRSSGNYNFTPFSMASILNMSYIQGINPSEIDINDYARCNKLIRENEVIKILSTNGYDIINYSIFDLAGNPAPVYQDFLPIKTKLISSRTLWGRVQKDILWNLFAGRFEMKWLTDNAVFFYLKNNNLVIDLVKEESLKKNKKPRFVYAHYNLPHPPYYYDKDGKIKDKKVIMVDDDNKASYLDNVKYTNGKIEELVNTIQKNTSRKAVIIVMGDHGFRHDARLPKTVFFENQNAVYLPDKNYKQLYDSITGVNQFRVLLNTLFIQRIPLLTDSTSFLKDKN